MTTPAVAQSGGSVFGPILHALKTFRMNVKDEAALVALEQRIRMILPEQYQDRYEDVKPVSMGSAGLKYGTDGKVAWDQIWGSFCDLAMAGGPPHKGFLLEPGTRAEIEQEPDLYRSVVEEIRRGIELVSGLQPSQSPDPGWVQIHCESRAMAEWLVRAIVMENVSARCDGNVLELPAGPRYRMGKEIKNVVTSVAKTCHYWKGHIGARQQESIAQLFARMAMESPLVQPCGEHYLQDTRYRALCSKLEQSIFGATGLRRSQHQYAGWIGLECPSVRSAIWMVRALVASNVLSRREDTVMFVPVNPRSDRRGTIVSRWVSDVHRLAAARGVLPAC